MDEEYFPFGEDDKDSAVKTYTYKYTEYECRDGQNIADLAKKQIETELSTLERNT